LQIVMGVRDQNGLPTGSLLEM